MQLEEIQKHSIKKSLHRSNTLQAQYHLVSIAFDLQYFEQINLNVIAVRTVGLESKGSKAKISKISGNGSKELSEFNPH